MSLFGKSRYPLDAEEQAKVVAAIQKVESATTGEVRVFMESSCTYVDAMDRAKEIFAELGMTNTIQRNAVLIYLAYSDRQFAMLGDEAIYQKAGGPLFWQTAANVLRSYLSEGNIAEGLVQSIHSLGEVLSSHFPFDPAIQKNELPDEIVFGKK